MMNGFWILSPHIQHPAGKSNGSNAGYVRRIYQRATVMCPLCMILPTLFRIYRPQLYTRRRRQSINILYIIYATGGWFSRNSILSTPPPYPPLHPPPFSHTQIPCTPSVRTATAVENASSPQPPHKYNHPHLLEKHPKESLARAFCVALSWIRLQFRQTFAGLNVWSSWWDLCPHLHGVLFGVALWIAWALFFFFFFFLGWSEGPQCRSISIKSWTLRRNMFRRAPRQMQATTHHKNCIPFRTFRDRILLPKCVTQTRVSRGVTTRGGSMACVLRRWNGGGVVAMRIWMGLVLVIGASCARPARVVWCAVLAVLCGVQSMG